MRVENECEWRKCASREEVRVKKRKYRRSASRESREGVRVEKDRVEQKCE